MLSPESRSVSEVSASEVVPWAAHLVPAQVSSVSCVVLWKHIRGWKLLCMIFNSSLPRFGGKWHFREKPRRSYIHLKNSRYIPPYPLVTPPELEGVVEFIS